jgi:hypothetical protein
MSQFHPSLPFSFENETLIPVPVQSRRIRDLLHSPRNQKGEAACGFPNVNIVFV